MAWEKKSELNQGFFRGMVGQFIKTGQVQEEGVQEKGGIGQSTSPDRKPEGIHDQTGEEGKNPPEKEPEAEVEHDGGGGMFDAGADFDTRGDEEKRRSGEEEDHVNEGKGVNDPRKGKEKDMAEEKGGNGEDFFKAAEGFSPDDFAGGQGGGEEGFPGRGFFFGGDGSGGQDGGGNEGDEHEGKGVEHVSFFVIDSPPGMRICPHQGRERKADQDGSA